MKWIFKGEVTDDKSHLLYDEYFCGFADAKRWCEDRVKLRDSTVTPRWRLIDDDTTAVWSDDRFSTTIESLIVFDSYDEMKALLDRDNPFEETPIIKRSEL